jgi:hypothetical protein
MARDSSPFHETDFVPIEDIYTTKGRIFGLQKPDGSIILNFDHKTSYQYLMQIARITNCEVVVVHGTWTFLPETPQVMSDEESDSNESVSE